MRTPQFKDCPEESFDRNSVFLKSIIFKVDWYQNHDLLSLFELNIVRHLVLTILCKINILIFLHIKISLKLYFGRHLWRNGTHDENCANLLTQLGISDPQRIWVKAEEKWLQLLFIRWYLSPLNWFPISSTGNSKNSLSYL